MRPLENFLHRRKISDPEQWLQRMGIHSQLALEAWCENNDIYAPEPGKYFPVDPITDVAEEQLTSKKLKAPQPPPGEEEIWHTPAAERPRRQTSKRPTATKKRKTSTSKKK